MNVLCSVLEPNYLSRTWKILEEWGDIACFQCNLKQFERRKEGRMRQKRKKKCHEENLQNKPFFINNQWTKSYFPLHWCLPRRFAYILAFRVEFLAETGPKEETNHRNNSKRVLHFHCTSSSILLDAVFTPHFPPPKVLMKTSHWILNTPICFFAHNPDVSALEVSNPSFQKGWFKNSRHHLRHRETQQRKSDQRQQSQPSSWKKKSHKAKSQYSR